jgi:hypothetical protein
MKPSLSTAQKFAALPDTTKIGIYSGSAAAGVILLSALIFTCIRQRRKGAAERTAYNAQVEKEREEAFKDQMELREKGLGGWNESEVKSQGDDALGGRGGSHLAPAEVPSTPTIPKLAATSMAAQSPSGYARSTTPRAQDPFEDQLSRAGSPAISRAQNPFEEQPSRIGTPTIPRLQSPTGQQSPRIRSPAPQGGQSWNPSGGLIQNAGSAYSGGYGGSSQVAGSAYSGNYSASSNSPRGPTFPLSPQMPAQRGFSGGFSPGGQSSQGYHRF